MTGRMIILSLSLATAQATLAARDHDSIPETPMSDTLKTVVVTDDGRLPIRVSDEAKERIGTKSLGDIVGGKAMDKMMHPFAIKQRKRERHRRKMARLLWQYDMVRDERDLLLEALRREGIDPDSLINAHKEATGQ
ncbi:MAG: hypothetical protein LUC33_07450 [Prevotellaceae bacterium]|nr:hypothetical protein [Prevotellaceae bacterium]